MSFAQRFVLVLFAAFFLSSALTSLAAFLCTPAVLRLSARMGAARAWMLAGSRLLPSLSAVAMTAFVLGPGYFRHEQRGEPEGVGLVLLLCGVAGAALMIVSTVRIGRGIAHTSRLRRHWMAEGRPLASIDAGIPAFVIETAYPLVAVLGVVRPTLFISRAVLESCTSAELAAIIEHERRHVSAFDNATRVAMDAAPDFFGLTRRSASLSVEWHHAVEHRADDAARQRLDLASALVRVARMAGNARPTPLPASALYRGDGIEDRVKRLLGEPRNDSARPALRATVSASVAGGVMLLIAVASSPAASAVAHGILEAIVSLP